MGPDDGAARPAAALATSPRLALAWAPLLLPGERRLRVALAAPAAHDGHPATVLVTRASLYVLRRDALWAWAPLREVRAMGACADSVTLVVGPRTVLLHGLTSADRLALAAALALHHDK